MIVGKYFFCSLVFKINAMKLKIALLFLIWSYTFGFGQNKTYDLLESHTETKILYDRVYPVS